MYPEQNLVDEGYINVSESPKHTLYWQEYGSPSGQPVMILHGGPGSGAMKDQARLFDPTFYRIIMFDQRGAGKSTPHASLEANTTAHLIEDINSLRTLLNVSGKMHLFGGSWGSTLALAYAIQHPDNIASITLYGVFLGREADIADFYQSNATTLNDNQTAGATQKELANEWQRYVSFIPKNERGDMIEAYRRRLHSEDKTEQLKAAQHWNRWERAASKRVYDEQTVSIEPEDTYSLAHARMENHYFTNGLFLGKNGSREQNYILENADKLTDIPLAIIQGVHDKVCPSDQAKALFEALKRASNRYPPQLNLIETAGHTMRDEGMIDALKEATDRFRSL